VFQVDSLLATRWVDSSRPENGVRISVSQEGSRVRIVDVGLIYRVRSSIADTIVDIPVFSSEKTLLYSPEPTLLEGAFRVGGAPAHRAAIHFNLPESADGDAEVCSLVPCPVELRADRLVYAGLQLYSRSGSPAGLLPLDTIGIDMRPVLSPEHLPRSPLGMTVQSIPTFLDPGIFAPGEETLVELPMTRYVRDLLREPQPGGDPVPSVLALMTGFEPWALEPATFWGVGSELEPVLRLVLTVSDGLSLP
jgi:hypothetical protein